MNHFQHACILAAGDQAGRLQLHICVVLRKAHTQLSDTICTKLTSIALRPRQLPESPRPWLSCPPVEDRFERQMLEMLLQIVLHSPDCLRLR